MASRPDIAPGLDMAPLSPAIGVEIRGIDLSRPVDAATGAAIRRAWYENSVILLRGQDLSPDDQMRF
ncbi:MAG: TauD/TfdA family dioxygenase, partial [Alphaproteobacteria bacterium]